ncbi:MAG: cation-translocating P-type ATPase [Oxalobacter sp.]|nr:cation-translocating P-type ATPase [Oxalobacter sp.]MBR5999956.1 cation-translocating P-type ATPase [Oxalobacter sp.]
MFKKINDFLVGWPMTCISGIFLLVSFALPHIGFSQGENLAWVSVAISGLPLFYMAISRLIINEGISKISSALLISIGMIASLMLREIFAAGEIAFIMAVGALLEEMTAQRAQKGLKNLIAMVPETGRIIRNSEAYIIPVAEIQVNDRLRVLPGETIPVDGIIMVGETAIDQSVMTGESLPVDKTVGDAVFSGTINQFGAIDIRATKVGQDSALQKLIQLVESTEQNQAPTQRIADKWASWLVPVSLCTAIATYFITGDIVRAVTVIVVFCPCALVLATPTAIMAAIGQATKHGVIIKSGNALEKMGQVNTIAFDKTGTLTYGKLEVSDVIPIHAPDAETLLRLAASAEIRSEHPLGKAIAAKAKENNLPLLDVSSFSMTAGKGVSAGIQGRTYFYGNEKYIRESTSSIDEATRQYLDRLRTEGKASVIVADRENVLGIIALSDVLRKESGNMIADLTKMGTKTVLLTGDNRKAAEYFASQIGIMEICADLLPEEKVQHINQFMQSGKVCMIGDGVNDAPALKTADVGIAMGTMGSDIAVEAADIALVTDDIAKIPYLKWLANTTIKTIKCGIALSMGINLVAVILSVVGILTPVTGALVHNAGSCFVVLLATLLYDRKYPSGNL